MRTDNERGVNIVAGNVAVDLASCAFFVVVFLLQLCLQALVDDNKYCRGVGVQELASRRRSKRNNLIIYSTDSSLLFRQHDTNNSSELLNLPLAPKPVRTLVPSRSIPGKVQLTCRRATMFGRHITRRRPTLPIAPILLGSSSPRSSIQFVSCARHFANEVEVLPLWKQPKPKKPPVKVRDLRFVYYFILLLFEAHNERTLYLYTAIEAPKAVCRFV